MTNLSGNKIVGILVLIVLGFLLWGFLTMPDQRTTGQHIGDAVDALPNVGKATSELQDKTPGERLGDKIKENTSSH